MSAQNRTPIGGTHKRDWGILREQRPLSDLAAGPDGYVRFDCSKCQHRSQVALTKLHKRFAPSAGLVGILNTLAPQDCPLSGRDASGNSACAFRYRDLR